MKNNDNNRLLWIVIALAVVMIGIGIGSKVLVDKVADRVIFKLQKEYSPSPYGPGIDPDKLDAEKILKSPVSTPELQIGNDPVPAGWDTSWEKQRN